MFNDEDDLAAYEDELYREESSSDESIDSEVEAYLYSQVHYSQNLSEDNIDDVDDQKKEDGVAEEVETSKTNSCKKSVIVISDSDDVRASESSTMVILSDSYEEDSVYSSKIKGKVLLSVQRPENQSTPKASPGGKKLSKLQGTKSPSSGKSYKDGIVQEVVVIRGSSDEENVEVNEEEFLTSDSDQSDVENWMLLGRAREDGDTSIQLNLKGHRCAPSEGDNEVDWSVTERDSEAQIKNFTPSRRSRNRYYTEDKNVICRNCNSRGHLSKNCPEPKKLPACCLCGERGHLQYSCSAPYCSNCLMPGHFHQDCTERPYWLKKCHRCCMIGHYADACPEIWRQYHLTAVPGPMKKSNSAASPKNIVYCCNCGKKGHCGYECNQRRMYSTVYPSCELVFSYDQSHEIWRRNQRAKRKLKELQDAGLVTLEVKESYSQDAVDNMQLRKKMRKKNKHKKPKKAENSIAINSLRQFKSQKKKKFILKEEEEDYFPRGKSEKSKKSHERKRPKHLLFKDFGQNEDTPMNKDKKKRRKRKSSAVDESLLIIKQRKKKSKTNK
ncbi:zinc finger CCHC domain-containing protein 7 [Dendropsophus ebraccatus]|uniref:zinc finger CCHC domain-containing protein 7 n=1 Tax=Dendropsophus ebraccatus TaxID=150705 RepID=UPI003831E089